ncbi:MAG: fructose-1,6-bisphosphatase [Cytophagaceae bacterium]|jgi:fructose-1,6-bisphosphatase-3|nr:fructose-1,6-bisphosphatase [Cytophagaceae bacterium]
MTHSKPLFADEELRFLNLLSQKFPTAQAASTEIVNLEAIMKLPKGTEHFLTDIHGEYETFNHILRNASGVVRRNIDEIFGKSITSSEKKQLATLIYYPEEKLDLLRKNEVITDEWYYVMLYRLVQVAREASQKYTRSKVRKAMPKDFAYIIDELINETNSRKKDYIDGIIQSIINIHRATHFIVAISGFIQRLLIDRLHIIGDIFDRGPDASKVMQTISDYHSFDIQWGNHDIIWIGAASGIDAHIAEVIRFSARYENIDTLEDAYGINLFPLLTFAITHYNDDPCECFIPKSGNTQKGRDTSTRITTMMHKAISVIGWKLEGQVIKRNPKFNLEHRLLLDKINYEKGVLVVNGKEYPIKDTHFPTVNPKDPYKLTPEEAEVMDRLRFNFLNSEKLQRHINVLIGKGSMYLKYNSNLLFHGCIPMTAETEFEKFDFNGELVSGKELCDKFDRAVRRCRVNRTNLNAPQQDFDYCWYLWCGPCSPLFGKKKMATFERYLTDATELHKEDQNAYFKHRDSEKACNFILEEFGLDSEKSHIVNGHMPVKVIKGEKPVKANGKLFVIDGGMSKPYRKETGISGYTLIFNSTSLILVEHQPFGSKTAAITEEIDIISSRQTTTLSTKPICVGDTDIGIDLRKQIDDLKNLLLAYQVGVIKEGN